MTSAATTASGPITPAGARAAPARWGFRREAERGRVQGVMRTSVAGARRAGKGCHPGRGPASAVVAGGLAGGVGAGPFSAPPAGATWDDEATPSSCLCPCRRRTAAAAVARPAHHDRVGALAVRCRSGRRAWGWRCPRSAASRARADDRPDRGGRRRAPWWSRARTASPATRSTWRWPASCSRRAIARRSWWALLPVAGFVAVIDRTQIRAEEEALRERFGEAYAAYARRVPRWVGPVRSGAAG